MSIPLGTPYVLTAVEFRDRAMSPEYPLITTNESTAAALRKLADQFDDGTLNVGDVWTVQLAPAEDFHREQLVINYTRKT